MIQIKIPYIKFPLGIHAQGQKEKKQHKREDSSNYVHFFMAKKIMKLKKLPVKIRRLRHPVCFTDNFFNRAD